MKTVFAIVFLATASVAGAISCARNYTVKLFDTCDSISAANNVSTYQLIDTTVNINTIDKNCAGLRSGQVLCLGLTGEDCTQTYVIQEGDYCWAIATSHDIDVNTLLVNNPNLDSECSNIYAGEVLCVAPTPVYP